MSIGTMNRYWGLTKNEIWGTVFKYIKYSNFMISNLYNTLLLCLLRLYEIIHIQLMNYLMCILRKSSIMEFCSQNDDLS